MQSLIDRLRRNQPDVLDDMLMASGLKSSTPPFNKVTFERLHELSRYLMLSGARSEMPKATGYLRTLQLGILQILEEFDRICTDTGMTYWLISGGLLGAVRHKGFIPWDDDLDVLMLRCDYERLVNEFNQRTRIKDLFACMTAVSRGRVFIQIRSRSATQLYMDVFPCDIIPEKLTDTRRRELSNTLNKAKYSRLFEKGDVVSPYAQYQEYLKRFIPNINQSGDYENGTLVLPYDAWTITNYMVDSSDYFPQAKIEFEGLWLPTLGKAKNFLHSFYHDYYTYPAALSLHHHAETLDVGNMLAVKNFMRGRYEDTQDDHQKSCQQERPLATKAGMTLYNVVQKIRKRCVKVFDVRTDDKIKSYTFLGKTWIRHRPLDKKAARFYFEGIETFSQLYYPLSGFPPARGYLRSFQLAQLKILKILFDVCSENALTCWLHYDTLLGSVRHNGFIPWDAGVAVMMPRCDYDKVFALMGNQDSAADLETSLVAPAGKGVFTRIALRVTPAVRVDVFSCDYLTKNVTYAERKRTTETIVQALGERCIAEGNYKEKQEYFENLRNKLFAGNLTNDMEACQTVVFGCECMPVTVLGMFDREDVFPLAAGIFEGEHYPIPRDSDYILTAMYGDYQTRHDNMIIKREFIPHYYMYSDQIEAFLKKEYASIGTETNLDGA